MATAAYRGVQHGVQGYQLNQEEHFYGEPPPFARVLSLALDLVSISN